MIRSILCNALSQKNLDEDFDGRLIQFVADIHNWISDDQIRIQKDLIRPGDGPNGTGWEFCSGVCTWLPRQWRRVGGRDSTREYQGGGGESWGHILISSSI